MTQLNGLIAFALSLAAAVATIGTGALLLRNSVKEASDLVSALPTCYLKEDTNEIRESNRRKARAEMLLLLAVRSAPGASLAIVGAWLVVSICVRFLPAFGA